MAKWNGILALVGLALTASAVSAAEVTKRVPMKVRLVDYAVLPPGALKSAEQQVSTIYAAAGVDIVWVDPVTSTKLEGPTFDVLLLSETMTDRFVEAAHVAPQVLAQAHRAAARAYILTERTSIVASHMGADFGDALGAVIAHELGHMFLSGHGPVGVMQGSYEFRNRSARRFTPDQADVIRRLLADKR